MKYYIDKTVKGSFDEVVVIVKSVLPDFGFGIVTEFDVDEKIKNKLNIDFRRYKVIGACNPKYAYDALQIEPVIGTMLPCNIVVQEVAKGEIMIAAIDPVASMQAVENEDLNEAAQFIKGKLSELVNAIEL